MSKQEKEATKKSPAPAVRCGCSANHQPATACDAIICTCGNEPHRDGFATVALTETGPRMGEWVEVEPTEGGPWKGHIQCGSCGRIFDDQAVYCGTAPVLMGTMDESDGSIPMERFEARPRKAEKAAKPLTEKAAVLALLDLFDNEQAVRDSDFGEALSETRRARTFREAGVLTQDEGIILRLKDGRSIFLTVQIQNGRL